MDFEIANPRPYYRLSFLWLRIKLILLSLRQCGSIYYDHSSQKQTTCTIQQVYVSPLGENIVQEGYEGKIFVFIICSMCSLGITIPLQEVHSKKIMRE